MRLRLCLACTVLCVIICLTGCGNQAPLPLSVSVSPQSTATAAGQTVQVKATVTNTKTGVALPATASSGPQGVTWSTTEGTVDDNGNFTAPSGTTSSTAVVTATSRNNPAAVASATIHVVAPGQVSQTANPQVALYSIAPAGTASVSIQFGSDTTYGLTTWSQPTPPSGGTSSLLVAGMKANTTYHTRAVVQFADGIQYLDQDQTFPTGAIPTEQFPAITVTTTPGMTPQSGVELLDVVNGASTAAPPAVTDLGGNVLWSYNPGISGVEANPIKLLANGHFLINFSNGAYDGVNSTLQEVDLTGALVWQMTAAALNSALAAATCSGCNITVVGTHHDFAALPNGHLIVIAATQQIISGTTVTGDVIIDLDQNHKPVWLWNEFDHLDVNRQPMGFPDWTHTNAVIYSADDGNLIVSMRHQNWLVKIDYANGSGAGDIIWKLGYQGDFTLVGGTDPTDWFYAQHGPSFTTTNTSGKFSLILFDNGNDRVFPSGVTCGTSGEPACLYSTVPLLQIDEGAKTATIEFNPTAPTYSGFGGNVAVLKNGNVEYCESAGGPGVAGDIYEITQDNNAQIVWHMVVAGQFAYRGQRIPSLYPGVQW